MSTNGIWRLRSTPQTGGCFQIAVGGDVCPGKKGHRFDAPGEAGDVFAAMRPFLAKDALNIAQWETPLAVQENPISKSGPNLNSPPETVRLLCEANFQVALLANNHTGDHGPRNVLETIRLLHQAGIKTVGAGDSPESAAAPLDLRCAGRKIRILNFCEHEFGVAAPGVPGTAGLNVMTLDFTIRQAAAEADLVLVVLHGGHEQNPYPSPRMTGLLRLCADAGASLVLNCHTHCPGGIEIYHGVPLVYSPGNLFFPNFIQEDYWKIGYLPIFRADDQGIYEVEAVPYEFDDRRVTPLAGERREAFLRYLRRISEPLQKPDELRQIFEAWSVAHGLEYLRTINRVPENWEKTFAEPETARDMLKLRNIFCCESHRDMIACFLRLVETGHTAEAQARFEKLRPTLNQYFKD